MERSNERETRLGWVVILLVLLGAIGSQLLGTPYVVRRAMDFRWTHGFPCVYMCRYGTKPHPETRGPSSLLDKTDSHWTTRLLVPILSDRDNYIARTCVLPLSIRDVYQFDASCLLVNTICAILVIGAAVYVKRRMAVKPACVVGVLWVMVALIVLCLALYVQIIMTLGDSLFVVLYKPPLVAFNILGAYCVGVAIWSLLEALWASWGQRKRRGQLNGTGAIKRDRGN